jgi:hypothetical protein
MRISWLVAGALAVALASAIPAHPFAQGGNASGAGPGAPPPEMASLAPRALTPFEEFTGKLKLDSKQDQAAEEIFNAAAREAAPIGVELLQIRQRMLNAALSGTPDDVKAASDAYAAAEAKMAAVEAGTFAKVYALLTPKQQSNAPQAFALMAGFFQSQGAGRRGGRQ